MRNPFQRLKYLPWLPLSLTGLATAVITYVFEYVLLLSYQYLPPAQAVLNLLFAPPLSLLIGFAVALGIGAVAVFWFEAVYPQISINTGVLWALVLCVLLAIALKSFLPLPVNLFTFNQLLLIGVVVGVFVKGKRYWR
ncbi:MAG: hypothetical protein Kow00121_03890 [Elainellaceae cyanobacterium]